MNDKPISVLIQEYAEAHTIYVVASGVTDAANQKRRRDERGDAASACLLAVIEMDKQRDRLKAVAQVAASLEAAGYPVPALLTKTLADLHDGDLFGPMLAWRGETGATG